ncbi:MAG: GNAT family N-acetyltransferase [Xanthomonadaceae bacterium]|jgi:predicted N-acyltransferase|nr:GNAT family N-acetyltransferase [Xanthomonadaceae bacterium]
MSAYHPTSSLPDGPVWLDALAEVPAAVWDSLHDGRNPFVSHAFLEGLERTGCLRPAWGWTPRHLTLWERGDLIGAVPGYIKSNSHGEFVFDHAWAQAYAHYGQEYFPKWLCAVPYSPVPGPRLLARGDEARHRLLDAMVQMTCESGYSSAHVNFHLADEDDCFGIDWLARTDVQYHWRNPGNWRTFEDYLAAMTHRYRKNIRQERAKVERSGVRFRILHGDEASTADLAAMYEFYLQTFNEYGNSPALTFDFLCHLAQAMPRQLVIFLARQEQRPIAGSWCLRGADCLYGRYWGALENIPGLHFETCYYQGIEYCLREGLTRFEPGAQGEHKIARGFLPTLVRSRHWIAAPAFRLALAAGCREETAVVLRYADAAKRHSPFRDPEVDKDDHPPAGR